MNADERRLENLPGASRTSANLSAYLLSGLSSSFICVHLRLIGFSSGTRWQCRGPSAITGSISRRPPSGGPRSAPPNPLFIAEVPLMKTLVGLVAIVAVAAVGAVAAYDYTVGGVGMI